jgi:hypothetical protein
MEKNNIEKAREIFIYAPLGAFGFVKDNAPTFFSMFVNRGKRDISKTNFIPNEKKTFEVHQRGEEVAQNVVDGAMKVVDFVESTLRTVADKIDVKEDEIGESIKHQIKEDEVTAAFEKISTDHTSGPSENNINDIISNYQNLSAPEIIGSLDGKSKDQLNVLLEHEINFRNRKTIIHAINYQLDNS